ncbi:MAG: OsmC family protein [Pseudobdellovibrionaceae bacterium]
MLARTIWTEKMKFTGECDGHSIELDAKPPFGDNTGLTPKALVAIAVAGCTGMDVVALMKKHKQPLESFEVKVDAPPVEKKQPPVFKEIALTFIFKGSLDKEKVIEAVHLSQTKYCAVSAMLSGTVPIQYKIFLNDEEIGTGHASFV